MSRAGMVKGNDRAGEEKLNHIPLFNFTQSHDPHPLYNIRIDRNSFEVNVSTNIFFHMNLHHMLECKHHSEHHHLKPSVTVT